MRKFYKILIVSTALLSTLFPLNVLAVMQSSNFKIYEADLENTAEVGPVISGISQTAGEKEATISWQTDQISDSFVIFDTDSGYSNSHEQGLSVKSSTSHSVTVKGLAAATTYYYKIKSTNLTGGLSIASNNYNFTTAPANYTAPITPPSGGGMLIIDKTDKFAPTISSVKVASIRSSEAIIDWQTDEISNSFVEFYHANGGKITNGQWDSVKNHMVNLNNLLPATDYYFKAISADGSGNLASSTIMTFKTLTLEAEQAKDKVEKSSATSTIPELSLSLQETLSNTIDKVKEFSSQVSLGSLEIAITDHLNALRSIISGIPGPSIVSSPQISLEDNKAVISWQTDKEAGSQIAFASSDMYKPGTNEPYYQLIGDPDVFTKNHQITIYDLKPGVVYHYQLRNKSRLGVVSKSIDYNFKSVPEAPGITNFYVNILSPERAVFRWLTNQETNTALRYVPYRGNVLAVAEAKTVSENSMSVIHQMEINKLEGGVVYQVELSGKTAKGEAVNKTLQDFSTSKDDLPPVISNVKTEIAIVPGKEEKTQAIISWQTNEPGTSKIYFKEGAGVFDIEKAEKTNLDMSYTRKHVGIITKFKLGQVYSYLVESSDITGNISRSQYYSVLIPKKQESIFDIILKIFLQAFGWIGKIG